jgi:hypothetical protein
MVTTSFFTDSQAQFDESQKKFADLWNESQKQLIESQKKLVDTWIGSLPNPIGTDQAGFSGNFEGNFEKTLNFQRELINSALNAQQVTTHLAIEAQKQFWDNYFQTTQRLAREMPNK